LGEYVQELETAERAAREAGAAVMAVFDSAAVRTKADGSYVTDADLASDRTIREIILNAFPDDAILTEEGLDDPARLGASRCWIADPIDGTAAFVAREDDFDVYIALVVEERPVVAVSFQPAPGLLLSAVAQQGAWITRAHGEREVLRYARSVGVLRIGTRPWLGSPQSLPVLENVARAIGAQARVVDSPVGLNARSFNPPNPLVEAVVGFRPNGAPLDSWEWDLAAVDLIVREAGGRATDLNGNSLRFNKPVPRVNSLLMSADPRTHEQVLTALSAVLDSSSAP
jgi:myo-inositol-1(or 4)-monophosphatase